MTESHSNRPPDQMDALVWTGPRQMEIQRLPVPTPGTDELLLAVTAVGICGSELSGYLGKNKLRVPPLVMGHEAAGRIVHTDTQAVMADGTQPTSDQRVTFNPLVSCGSCDACRIGKTNLCYARCLIGAHRQGAFAAYVTVPAKQCYPLPDNLTDTAGALTETVACAVRAVETAGGPTASSLLIIGAGPIGLACLAVARHMGAETIVIVDISEHRLEVAERWGATVTMTPDSGDFGERMRKLAPFGVNAVIDAVGSTRTRQQSIQAAAPGGRVVWIGLHEEESSVPANWIIRSELKVEGSFAYAGEDFARALELQNQGVFAPSDDWLIERPLDRGQQAFDELVDGKAQAVKYMLRVG